MGSDYIVQSFMTVVVGGVGNIWGTLAGAAMIGGFQKGIEFLNPSNTLAAQTFMIIFIIIFIQFRPTGHHRPQRSRGGGLRAWNELLYRTQPVGLDLPRHMLALFTLGVTVLSEGFGIGLISTSFVKGLGQDAVPVPDRHRDGPDLGLHGHPIAGPLRVLRPWRLYDRHVVDV